jgi:hypothetical protein
MPATYTYNDALEDAKRCVIKAWEEKFDETVPEHMDLVLAIVGRLEDLKRPSRRKRAPKPAQTGGPLAKILDEDRIKGPARIG